MEIEFFLGLLKMQNLRPVVSDFQSSSARVSPMWMTLQPSTLNEQYDQGLRLQAHLQWRDQQQGLSQAGPPFFSLIASTYLGPLFPWISRQSLRRSRRTEKKGPRKALLNLLKRPRQPLSSPWLTSVRTSRES